MDFKKRYNLRNTTLKYLYWFVSLSGLVSAYGLIKYIKLLYYNERMFKNVNPYELDSLIWLNESYFTVGGYSLLAVLVFTIFLDIGLRKVYVKI